MSSSCDLRCRGHHAIGSGDGEVPLTIAGLVPSASQPPGCRDIAITTGFLLGFGIVMFAIGLTLINREACSGVCEVVGLTLLYAGGPISALIGVFTETVIVAWPLDVMLWVILGFGVARWAENRGRRPLGVALVVLLVFLAPRTSPFAVRRIGRLEIPEVFYLDATMQTVSAARSTLLAIVAAAAAMAVTAGVVFSSSRDPGPISGRSDRPPT